MDKSRILVLDALLRLRQVCCDPRLLSATLTTPIPKQSAKLDALMVLLTNLLAEGRRVLVFSQFTSMLSLIEEKLQIAEFPYLLLTGKSKNRSALVQQFQEGKVPLFLISLKAGGIGLNLTKADTVIHYDPWWNPAVEQQATDRSHRIGQISPVFVYKLITQGTIEESILALQKKKQGLIENILNMEAATLGLSDTVLDQLLMPLFDMP
jgi:SNF2 family DNA or RNA helicase